MSADVVDVIAKAVLYEGYILYPYRPSATKNQRRWNFGGVYPRAYSERQTGTDRWTMQTQCLAEGDAAASIAVTIRFLRVVERTLRDATGPVPVLRVDDREIRAWQEAVEERVALGPATLAALAAGAVRLPIALAAVREVEPVNDAAGRHAGDIIRERRPLDGAAELAVARLRDGIARVTVRVTNTTALDPAVAADREQALRHTMASTHAVLRITGGRFLSLADPPENALDLAAQCVNDGVWPVLVGAAGQNDTVLASPIILDDHPEVAPESPGDLFDSSEIDEILTLRILALSDAEKAEMREADERARALLERTEALAPGDLLRMHGAMRRPTVHGLDGE